jgi:hypothetical protein
MAAQAIRRATGQLRLGADDRRKTINQSTKRGCLRDAITDKLYSKHMTTMGCKCLKAFRAAARSDFANDVLGVHGPADKRPPTRVLLGDVDRSAGRQINTQQQNVSGSRRE